jgi:hypothetical protein
MDNKRCPEKAKIYGSNGKISQKRQEERWSGL